MGNTVARELIMSTIQPTNTSSLKQLEVILQSILSLAAVIYSIGFIIVNSYYTSFGVTDYQLIQTRYIAAGLSYLFIHVGIASMIATILIVIDVHKKIMWVLAFLIIWSLFGLAIYQLSKSVVNSFIVGVSAGIVTLIGYQIWAIWTNTRNLLLDSIPKGFETLFIGTGITILICINALVWGRSFWPIMSSNLGGGRPNEAIFVFEAQSIPLEGLPFIPMQNSTVTEQLPILFDNASEFVVLVKAISDNPVAVRIPKSTIISIIYAPPEPFGKKQMLPTLTPETKSP